MFDRQLFATLARRHRQLPHTPLHESPVAPLPIINDQPPVLLVFDDTDLGIDLAYERDYVPGGPVVRGATPDSALYWVPRLTPVFVAGSGSILFAQKQSQGFTIIVDHGNDWLTVYSRLEHMLVPSTDRKGSRELKLDAGDILGYLGATRGGPLRPLRFELWRCNRLQDYDQIDPITYLRRWRQIDWGEEKAQLPPTLGGVS